MQTELAFEHELILVVDDEPASRLLLRRILETDGYRVDEAASGAEALRKIDQVRPSVVFVDGMMPEMDGFEVCAHIQELPNEKQIPVIMVTSLDDRVSIDRAFEAGAADYVAKPIHWPVVRRRLRRLLMTERAERKLQEQHNLLRALIDNIPDYIYIKDIQSRYLISNKAHAQLLGGETPADVIGKSDYDLFPQDIAADYQSSDQMLIHYGQPLINKEQRIQDTAGNPKWVLTTKVPLRNHADTIIGVIGISRDITERKLAEQAILKSEAAEHEQRILAEALRDTAAALASTLEPEAVMNQVLRNVGHVVPHDAADIMLIEGDAAHVVAHQGYPVDVEATLANIRFSLEVPSIQRMVSTQTAFLIEDTAHYTEWVHVPETAWIRSCIRAPIEIHGTIIGFLNLNSAQPGFFTPKYAGRLQAFADQVGIAIDNAHLYEKLRRYAVELELRVKERTSELNRAKEHVEAIFNNSSDGLLIVQTDGTIDQANPACSDMFGYPQTEVVAQPFIELIEPDHVERLTLVLSAVTASGSAQRMEIVARRKDTTTFFADIVLSPIVQANELIPSTEVSEVICSIRDITERKLAERELQELNQLKTEFLSTAAHELRTPLASIVGFSELLLTREIDAERVKRYISIIHEQSIQLRTIIDALLDISRIEAKQGLTLDLRPLSLVTMVTETLPNFAEHLPKYQFQMEGIAQCPGIIGDRFRLSQVLQNILSNAMKYSPNGGPITIRAQVIPGFIQISVQDRGIGMTQQQQRHLFERFYRADSSNTTLSGAGLGLAISKMIVELHGGRIWAESEYNVGTTIYFTLPLPG